MIFKVENLKTKGYFARVYNKRNKIYEELIKKHELILNDFKDILPPKEEDDHPELFTKKISELTDKEKKLLYERAFKHTDDYLRAHYRYKKPYNELDDYDFESFRRDISLLAATTLYEEITLDIKKEEEFLDNLVKAKNSSYIFTINKDELNPTNVLYFKKFAKKLWEEGKDVKFVICQDMLTQSNTDRINYTYTKDELSMLWELDNYITDHGGKGVLFREFLEIEKEEDLEEAWTLKEVMAVNNNIDRIVNVIKNNNYTPFETMIFLHKYFTTHFFYNKGELEESRILPGIYFNTKIVCSGYASLMKAVIDRLDNPNLKADIMGCKLFDVKPPHKIQSSHCQNLIYIKDDKYDIDGYYVEDLTYDCKKLFNGNKQDGGFAHCLLPLDAITKMNDYIYASVPDKNRYKNLMTNKREIKGIAPGYVAFVARKYGDKSNPIDVRKYEKAIGKVFAKSIKRGSLSVDKEIEKSIRKTSAFYSKYADVSFVSPETRLIRAIFGAQTKKKKTRK
jgi:hypothetical protein